MKISKQKLVAFATIGLLASAPAELVYHWTFDADGANTVGGVDMTLNANASISESCSIIGDGAIRITNQGAPAVGGAVTESAIDWSAFANGDTRTIALWVRAEVAQEGNATWFGAGVNANGERFDIKTNGQNFRVEIQGTGQSTGEFQPRDATWHHVAVVIPNAASTMSDVLFYVDGAEINNANTNTNIAINTATAILRIGDSSNGAADRDFNGVIDDVRIYDTALDLAEIQALATPGRVISCFESASDTVILGNSVDLAWESDATTTLVITNDQDSTSIDAFAIGADGLTAVSPTTTTTYTITSDGGSDTRDFTINVQTTPNVNSLTDSPELIYGFGDVTLNWTTEAAGRIEINDDQGSTPIVFTATADTQAFLDAGSVTIPNVSTTTVYTLTATIAEDGTGDTATLQTTATVQPGPDVTLVAAPTISNGPSDVTLFFNATVIETVTEISDGIIDGFGTSSGLASNQVQDSAVADFATILPNGPYVFEVTDGDIIGAQYDITGFSGNILEVDGDPSSDGATWQSYRIIETSVSGADSLSISDGTSTVFSTSDQAVIANGSVTLTNVSADTTYTASATITGFGTSTDDATFTVTGDGSSYEELILSQNPVGYYRFEESLGSSVIYDSSGNAAHSTAIDNPQFLASGNEGIFGNAGTFSEPAATGTSVVTGVTLDPSTTDWSVTTIARPDDLLDGQTHLFSNRDGTGTGRTVLSLRPDDATLFSFMGGVNSPSTDETMNNVNLDTVLVEGFYRHFAATYEVATGTLRFYLDGVLEFEGANITAEAADGGWVIGAAKANQSNLYWDGIIDEAAIFSTALSPAEVSAQANLFLANAPVTTVTITNCGFESNGDFFIDVAEGVSGFKVTTSPDLSTAFADATGVTNDGANRFTIAADSLTRNFFRVESE